MASNVQINICYSLALTGIDIPLYTEHFLLNSVCAMKVNQSLTFFKPIIFVGKLKIPNVNILYPETQIVLLKFLWYFGSVDHAIRWIQAFGKERRMSHRIE